MLRPGAITVAVRLMVALCALVGPITPGIPVTTAAPIGASSAASSATPLDKHPSFEIKNDVFLMDGKPFQIISGR